MEGLKVGKDKECVENSRVQRALAFVMPCRKFAELFGRLFSDASTGIF